jgi:hypothetical protein
VHHPLRLIVPPLIVIAAIVAVYIPLHRHAVAVRTNPRHHVRKPFSHTTAGSVVAGALIVAFICAFILP